MRYEEAGTDLTDCTRTFRPSFARSDDRNADYRLSEISLKIELTNPHVLAGFCFISDEFLDCIMVANDKNYSTKMPLPLLNSHIRKNSQLE